MKTLSSLFFATAIASLAACAGNESDDDDNDCAGGKCDALEGDDEPLETPCDSALFDRSGRGFLPKRLEDDALIKHVYMDAADGCPVTMQEIMETLQKNDTDGCSADGDMKSHVVSEQAQLNGSSDGASYRLITSRKCGDREEFGLLFSLFGFADVPQLESVGLHPGGDAFPDGVEIIAFDEEQQVFNYYKEVGGKMGFFGSSTDFVMKEPGGPNLTSVRGCGNCHTGGGLIQKELQNAWAHWEEIPAAGVADFSRNAPGARELVESREKFLGERAGGPHLEARIIKPGNEAWNKRRVQFVNDNGTVEDLLKPLFCNVELQIASSFNKRSVSHDFLIDEGLLAGLGKSVGRIATREADYDAMLKVSESEVAGSNEVDIAHPMAFINRSHADRDYVEKLIDAELIDRDFANDVLMVDFTRQAFSNERCDLLEFSPDIATDDRTPESIRDGFIDNLAGAADGTPEGQLLEHLQARVDGEAFDHSQTVDTYLDACADREQSDQFADSSFGELLGASEFLIDALKLRSLHRKTAMTDGVLDSARGSSERAFDVFEFGDTLPFDTIEIKTSANPAEPLEVGRRARFSPIDCSLVDEFTPAGSRDGGGGGTATECPGTCGEFVNGADCQCDDDCVQFGNCCDGWEPVLDSCPGEPFEFVDGASCQCDDRCQDFGNCCDGWETMCLG